MLTSSKELTVLVRGCDFDAMTFLTAGAAGSRNAGGILSRVCQDTYQRPRQAVVDMHIMSTRCRMLAVQSREFRIGTGRKGVVRLYPKYYN